MLYMIALQNMTICPFRCVDEINQVRIFAWFSNWFQFVIIFEGMDPTNERRVFELLVKHSSDKANSQYFLLSPKVIMKKMMTKWKFFFALAFTKS